MAYGPDVFVWGGFTPGGQQDNSIIWIFNSFTREWKAQICTGELPEGSEGSCALAHNGFLYLFAGFSSSSLTYNKCLYRLDLKTFVWSRADGIPHEGALFPSERQNVCGWVYGNKLYYFGGVGPDINSDPTFIKGCGTWQPSIQQPTVGPNNQVVAFDLDTGHWEGVVTHGTPPLPRQAMGCAIADQRYVFIFGGVHNTPLNDLHRLDMADLHWSGDWLPSPSSIEPSGRYSCTLSAVSNDLLFLYGGVDPHKAGIADFVHTISTRTWTQTSNVPDLGANCLFQHTASTVVSPPRAPGYPGVYVFGGILDTRYQSF